MGGHYSKVPHYHFLSLALRFRTLVSIALTKPLHIPSIPRVSVIRAN